MDDSGSLPDDQERHAPLEKFITTWLHDPGTRELQRARYKVHAEINESDGRGGREGGSMSDELAMDPIEGLTGR